MVAFLSHSSKDKPFVQAVASSLGAMEYELDEETFEYTLNVSAIRGALQRSDLVVFFVSKNSVSSTFVAEEQRQTLEAMGRGAVKKVLVFAIDDTSFRALPEWLREINVAQKITSPQLCSRRIQSALTDIAIVEQPDLLYLGRDEDETKLRRVLRSPTSETPSIIYIAGFHGVGRRTFLKETLKKVQPGRFISFPTITVNQYSAADDIYRSLYRLTKFTSLGDQIDHFDAFEKLGDGVKADRIAEVIDDISRNRELLIVYDEGNGVFSDSGELYSHWKRVTKKLEGRGKPVLAFIQTRSQPMRYRVGALHSFHHRLNELDRESCKEIISFSLKNRNVDYTERQIDDLTDLSGGHPFNIRIAIGLSEQMQVKQLLENPSAFISWRDRRGEEFLADLAFAPLEAEIMAILVDYRYASTETLLVLLGEDRQIVLDALQTLQDFFCVEFRNGVFNITSPIREAARRDERFARIQEWHEEIASSILEIIGDYTSEDDAPVSLLETATLAAVRSGDAPAKIRSLVLPSHFLMIAREHYDEGRRKQCIELCRQAFEYRRSMTQDAIVETLRIWALSAARIPDEVQYGEAIGHLERIGSQLSVRTLAFVRGFAARLKGRDNDAETFYKEAWTLSPSNGSINRELAKLYSNQRRFNDAEGYARQAYSTSPTNPYVIDVMVDVLEGKKSQGQPVDETELKEARRKLEVYGSERGFSFHFVREAQRLLNAKDYIGSISFCDRAIENSPHLQAPYFIKAQAQLHLPGGAQSADETLTALKQLISQTGTSEGTASSIAEVEISIAIEKGQFSSAKTQADTDRRLPDHTRKLILSKLARTIAFAPDSAPSQLRDWARSYLK